MRSLFGKIFLWFCITVVFGLVCIFTVTYLFNLPGPEGHRGPIHRLIDLTNRDMINAFESSKIEEMKKQIQTFHLESGITARIYDSHGRELSGLESPEKFNTAVAEHLATVPIPTPEQRRKMERWRPPPPRLTPFQKSPPPPSPPDGLRHGGLLESRWVFSADGTPYIRLLQFPSPIHFLKRFRSRGVPWRLCIFMLAGFLLSYLLARHLSRPVRSLQIATQKLRAGDLSVRVGHNKGLHYTEIRNLAQDFDSMAERLEKLVHTQQRLICDISHELRSPLTRLNLSLELARKRSGPEIQADLDRIGVDSARLEELINQVLTFARLDNLTKNFRKDTVNLGALLVSVARDTDLEAQTKDVALRVDVQSTAVLLANRELLRRALENVIRNAIRHTPERSTIDICLAPGGDVHEVLVQIRDYGTGAPEEHLADLFRPFFRVDDSRGRNTGGTGLGLAIAYQAVRLHGGRISAANAPGGGLVVDIHLPLTN